MTMAEDNIRHYLVSLNGCHGAPVIFKNSISDWPASKWKPDNLHKVFGEETLKFRLGEKDQTKIQWEGKCVYEHATIAQFNDWLSGQCDEHNPLRNYLLSSHWCYADYKYMSELFATKPQILKEVDWSTFGFPDRDGDKSTFWLGSRGAYTVCHYDTYGCNLVAQIYGRKRWLLFPPSQTENLYPTRIPYEESSVFSRVNPSLPDLHRHPLFEKATPYIATLEPGDVLFIPRHWWHYVECIDTAISINSWIELPEDDRERVKEAVVRTVALGLMSEDCQTDLTDWLNPTEDATDHSENLQYLRLAVKTFVSNTDATSSVQCRSNSSGLTAMAHQSLPTPIPEQCLIERIPCSTFDKYRKVFCDGCDLTTATRDDEFLPASASSAASGACCDECSKAGSGETKNRSVSGACRGHGRLLKSTVKELSTADLVNAILEPSIVNSIVDQLEKSLLHKY